MAVLVATLSILLSATTSQAKEIDWNFIEKVLVAEAANQGYDGMEAVAWVMYNRNFNMEGFSGGKRTDLTDFYDRQPKRVKDCARKIIRQLGRSGIDSSMVDSTGGAYYYENIRSYGKPKWYKEEKVTLVIGDHVFWTK